MAAGKTRVNPKWIVFVLLSLAAGAAGFLLVGFNGSKSHQVQTAYEGTKLEELAPDFRLVDQNGADIRLSDFRGRIVVLSPLDSRCKEVCPLTAIHLRLTYERLKRSQVDVSQVVFLGVNVNVEANTKEDVMQFTRRYGLDGIPQWHFLTGTAEALESVWQAYDIGVRRLEDGDIQHTPGIYLIDPAGRKRWYISVPLDPELAASWEGPSLSQLLVKQILAWMPLE